MLRSTDLVTKAAPSNRQETKDVSVKFEPEMKRYGAIAASASAFEGMDGSISAQYGWGCGLPGRWHFRRVAKAGDEGVFSMTLRRAG